MRLKAAYYLFFAVVFLTSCKDEWVVVPNNTPPHYGSLPTVLVENYVNRCFIDLIGREPLDRELDYCVAQLRATDYAVSTRDSILRVLQNDTAYVEGDTSYMHAYYRRYYELMKGRFIEGASDDEINQRIGVLEFDQLQDSLNGDFAGVAENQLQIDRLRAIILTRTKSQAGEWTIDTVCRVMINNAIFDEINMNTFNFVNATFDYLFWRYPTENEFWTGFNMIEFNQSGVMFGLSGSNREEYLDVMMQQLEFYEGNIIWLYNTLLARNPTTEEVVYFIDEFVQTKDFKPIQRKIMVSDEYAGF